MINKIQPVILCGGSGTRLWPHSRQSLPKQFVPLIEGKGLLQLTFERVKQMKLSSPIQVVANVEHRFLVNDAANFAEVECHAILEPVGRNTAAAMAASALRSEKSQLLLFMPADHHIPDVKQFESTVRMGVDAANNGAIVTFGVTPTSPHTGYGYIHAPDAGEKVRLVDRFVEKPDELKALGFFGSGEYFWNAGIFLVRAEVLLEALSCHAPDILKSVEEAVGQGRAIDSGLMLKEEIFIETRSESIDYAVLEHFEEIVMVPFTGAWSDVGGWHSVSQLMNSDHQGNCVKGQGYCYDTKDTFIYSPLRPVVTLGVENLMVIDTSDAVLITTPQSSEDVKSVVADLKSKQIHQAIEHRHAYRPWGEYDSVHEGAGYKVKHIKVRPGGQLSLQKHQHRAEHWVIIKGLARVHCGDQVFELTANQSTFIPQGELHRLKNIGDEMLELIEVQSGDYLGEDDIERYSDDYGRNVNSKVFN